MKAHRKIRQAVTWLLVAVLFATWFMPANELTLSITSLCAALVITSVVYELTAGRRQ